MGSLLRGLLGPGSMLVFLGLIAGCGSASSGEVHRAPISEGPAVVSGGGVTPKPSPAAPLQVAGGPARPDVGVAGEPGGPARVEAPSNGCGAQAPPPSLRRGGGLTVNSPPRPRERSIGSRMRTDIEGPLTAAGARVWVGIDVPGFVQIAAGTLELFLLDAVRVSSGAAPGAAPDGFLAFYRDPYDASSCGLSGNLSSENCTFGAALYDCSGKRLWTVTLNAFLSRTDHLEIQDVRYDGGVLYFNEACQSYSKEAGSRCSSIVALDPVERKVLWRSQPLTSNNAFVVHGRYLITGYGFTAEPDFLFVMRRSDGKVMQRLPVTTAHERMVVRADGSLSVMLYDNSVLRFTMTGFDGDAPRLVKIANTSPRTMDSF